MANIGIYGFGRIGRLAMRAAISRRLFIPSCIADVKNPHVFMSLFRYDSNQGTWAERTAYENGKFIIGSTHIRYYDSSRSIPPWCDLDVDTVVDCSALSTTRAGAERHISAGARKVLVSAASKTLDDCDAVLLPGIMGILEEEYASSRVIGESHSSLVDLPLVDILDGRLLSIAAWYDNEMGYAHRLVETAAYIAGDGTYGE